MTNYIEFSAKIKEKYPEYKDVDDLTLAQKMVEKYPEYKERVTFEEVKQEPKKQGIDLTPSGIAKQGGSALSALIETPFRMAKDKQSLPEAFKSGFNEGMEAQEQMSQNQPVTVGSRDFLTDLAGYSALPVLRGSGALNFVGNAAIQGGIPGAVESLKREGNVLGGGAAGTGIAALLQTIPYIGKGLGKVGDKALELSGRAGQIKPETLKQVIKPESTALEMTSDDASNALLDLTKNIRESYSRLLRDKGEKVNEAVSKLGQKTGRISVDDLISDIKSTFDNYQKDLVNPARELAGGLENELVDLINRGKPKNEIRDLLDKIDTQNILQGKAYLTNVSDDLLEQAKNAGYDLSGFTHDIDSSAVRHARKEHGIPKTEESRGQIPVNNSDFEALPRILDNPDTIDFVGKNKLGRDVIKYTKDMPDNITNYFEEIRNGQKTLSGDTLYKHKKGGRTAADAAFPTSKTIPTNNIITDNEAYFNSVSPLSLQGIKETIGKMAKWGDETARGYAEPITEKIYGKFTDRLSELSPELKAANKAYSDLVSFKKDDTLKQILKGDLLNGDRMGAAPSALKSYRSSINKAVGAKNLQELENVLVNEAGQEPFLNKIDDINAAMDLLKTETTGFGGIAGLTKALLTRPVLNVVRGANRANLPQKIQNIKKAIAPIAKLLPALGAKGAANMLYGGVEYNDYR